MSKIIYLILVALLLNSSAFAGKGDKILSKSLKKMGGKENLNSLSEFICEYSSVESKGTDTASTKAFFKGDSLKFTTVKNKQSMEAIWNGSNGWAKGKALRLRRWTPLNSWQAQQMNDYIFRKEILSCLISNLSEEDSITYERTEELDGQDLINLKIIRKSGGHIPNGFMIVKIGEDDNLIYQYIMNFDYTSQGGGMQIVNIYVNNYKEVGDYVLPHKITIDRPGLFSEMFIKSIEITPVEDGIFDDPSELK